MKIKIHTNPHLVLLVMALIVESMSLFGNATEVIVFLGVILFEFIYFAYENELIKLPSLPKPAMVKAEINRTNTLKRKEL